MFGYCFSNALISTCRTSVPLLLMGLAHQLIEPDADPVADAAAGELLLLLLLLPPPLLQPVTASAPGHPGHRGQPPAPERGSARFSG